jgi:nucleoside-diphosphate-sugar epimerase
MDLQEVVRRPVFYEDRYPDEANPKRTPDRGQGYSMGKLVAERAFADAAAASGAWDSIMVCPGDNVGPIQSPHQRKGAWQDQIAGMLEGKCVQNGVYRPWMTVDVRDDADCHVRLLESSAVKNGERYIAWSTDKRNVEDICADIDRLLPELRHRRTAPIDPFPDRIKAREAEFRAIWAGTEIRNDRIRAIAPIAFRPLDESIRDCVESLISIARVEPARRPGNDEPSESSALSARSTAEIR